MTKADPSGNAANESHSIRDVTRTLKNLSADMVRIVVVEARLFGHTVLAMIALTVVIVLLLVGVWLFTGAAVVTALASLQAFSLTGALLTVALTHLVLAALAFWRLRYISRDLTFRESRASANSLRIHARALVDTVGDTEGVDTAGADTTGVEATGRPPPEK